MGINKYNMHCDCVRVASQREAILAIAIATLQEGSANVVPPHNDILDLIMPLPT